MQRRRSAGYAVRVATHTRELNNWGTDPHNERGTDPHKCTNPNEGNPTLRQWRESTQRYWELKTKGARRECVAQLYKTTARRAPLGDKNHTIGTSEPFLPAYPQATPRIFRPRRARRPRIEGERPGPDA
jgi:hypothetical protein